MNSFVQWLADQVVQKHAGAATVLGPAVAAADMGYDGYKLLTDDTQVDRHLRNIMPDGTVFGWKPTAWYSKPFGHVGSFLGGLANAAMSPLSTAAVVGESIHSGGHELLGDPEGNTIKKRWERSDPQRIAQQQAAEQAQAADAQKQQAAQAKLNQTGNKNVAGNPDNWQHQTYQPGQGIPFLPPQMMAQAAGQMGAFAPLGLLAAVDMNAANTLTPSMQPGWKPPQQAQRTYRAPPQPAAPPPKPMGPPTTQTPAQGMPTGPKPPTAQPPGGPVT